MISKKGSTDIVKNRLNLISYSDGNHTLLEISEKCNAPFSELLEELTILVEKGVLEINSIWD